MKPENVIKANELVVKFNELKKVMDICINGSGENNNLSITKRMDNYSREGTSTAIDIPNFAVSAALQTYYEFLRLSLLELGVEIE